MNKHKDAFAGMLGGSLANIILHPIDIVRSRTQVGNKLSFPKTVKTILKTQGFRGLYSGGSIAITANAIAWGLYFKIYNILKNDIFNDKWYTYLASGYFAGIPVLIVTNPLWVIKTQAALQYGNKIDPIRFICKNIYQKDGIKGFYRGFQPGVVNCFHGSVQFYTYENMKKLFGGNETLKTKSGIFISGFVLGGLSKATSTTVMYPITTIRVRLQDQHKTYFSTKDVIRSIWREFGFKGFYRGLSLQLMLKSPLGSIIFSIYESIYSMT